MQIVFASIESCAIFTTPKSTVKSTFKKINVQMDTVETDIEKSANSTTLNQVALNKAVHIYTQ